LPGVTVTFPGAKGISATNSSSPAEHIAEIEKTNMVAQEIRRSIEFMDIL
jgi:hypothetical protein